MDMSLDDPTVSLQPRKRKSESRRSSILKMRPSPTRQALSDIDGNSHLENTATTTKRRRHSRRVSFAKTYQVKEFVKEAGWNQSPATADSQDPESCTRQSGDSSSHGTGITGLEHLLRGPIQMDVPLSQNSLSSQGRNQEAPGSSNQGTYSQGTREADDTADTVTLLQGFSTVNSSGRVEVTSVQQKHYSCQFEDYQGVYVTDTSDFNTLSNTSVNSYVGMASGTSTVTTTTAPTRPLVVSHLGQRTNTESLTHACVDRTQVFDADMDFTQCLNVSAGDMNDSVFASPGIRTVDSKNFLSRFKAGSSAVTTTVSSPAFGDRTQLLDADMDLTQCLNASTVGKCFLGQTSRAVASPDTTKIDAQEFLSRLTGGTWSSGSSSDSSKRQIASPDTTKIDAQEFLNRLTGGTWKSESSRNSNSCATTPPGDADRTIYFGANNGGAEDGIEFTACLNVPVHVAKGAAINKVNEVERPVADETIYFGANNAGAEDGIEFTACLNVPVHVAKGAAINRVNEVVERPVADQTVVFGDAVNDSAADMELTGVVEVSAAANELMRSKVSGATTRGDRPDKVVSAMVRSATGEGNVAKADVTVYGDEDGFTSRMDLTTCVGALNLRLTATAVKETPAIDRRRDLETSVASALSLPPVSLAALSGGGQQQRDTQVHTGEHTVVFGDTVNDSVADMDFTGVVDVGVTAHELISSKVTAHELMSSKVDGAATRGDRVVSAAVSERVADLSETSAASEGNIPQARSLKADTTVYGGEEGFTSRMDLTTCMGALNPSLTATAPPLTSEAPGRAASDRTVSDLSETSGHGEGNIPQARSLKADTTVYGGEDGFTSRMDFTSCVGTLNPRLTATGKTQAFSNTSSNNLQTPTVSVLSGCESQTNKTLHQEVDNHTVVFGDASDENMAAMELTGVGSVRKTPPADSLKADVTVFGGEDGFTSRMEFTSCVGTLNPTLTATAHLPASQSPVCAANDSAVSAMVSERVAHLSETSGPGEGNIPQARSLKADTTVYGGEDGFTSRMDFTSCVGTLNPTLTATDSTSCQLETAHSMSHHLETVPSTSRHMETAPSSSCDLETAPSISHHLETAPSTSCHLETTHTPSSSGAGNDREKQTGEGQMQVVFDARTSESLTTMSLAVSVMADQSTGSTSDCSDADKTIPPSHDITSCHTLDTDMLTPALCNVTSDANQMMPASCDITSCHTVSDKDLSSRFKLPVSVGPQNTSVALSGQGRGGSSSSSSSSSNDLEVARQSASSLESVGIMQEGDLDFLDSPILMSKSISMMGDTFLGHSTLAFNQSKLSVSRWSNTSSSVLERSRHTRERNMSARNTISDTSMCSQSILNLSPVSMSALLAGGDLPLLPEVEPTTLNDYFQLMGVNLDIKTKPRRSIIPFVSTRSAETVSDKLQLGVYPPQVEMYQWANDCMTAQINRCKEQNEDFERRLLADLPPVLRDYNSPENQRTLQGLATRSNLRSMIMFKEWRGKIVRGILDRVRDEEQELEEAVEELRVANSQLTTQLDTLTQYEQEMCDLESKLDSQLSQLDVLEVQLPAVQTELRTAEDRKRLVDAEVTKLSTDKSRLTEDLASLKALRATAEQEVAETEQKAPDIPIEDHWDKIQRLLDYSTFRPETWDADSGALFSALNGSLHLRFQFAGRKSCDSILKRQPALHISDVEIWSRLTDEAPARERLVHGILLKGVLARGKLTDQCPDTNKLPAFIRTLSVMVTDADHIHDQLCAIELRHEVVVDTRTSSVEVQFSSRKAHALFHVTFQLPADSPSQTSYPWTFKTTIGVVTETDITEVMSTVTQGPQYLQRCVHAIDNFLLQHRTKISL